MGFKSYLGAGRERLTRGALWAREHLLRRPAAWINRLRHKRPRLFWASAIMASILVIAIIAGAWYYSSYHSDPKFCTFCHLMDTYLESWESPPLLAYSHGQEDVVCLDCHSASIGEQISELFKYITGDFEDPLDERKYDTEECFVCHEHGSYEQIIELTQYLVEEAGRNPHDSPHLPELDCRLCHKIHRLSIDGCAECHPPVATGDEWTTP